jgi:hypothetical protein
MIEEGEFSFEEYFYQIELLRQALIKKQKLGEALFWPAYRALNQIGLIL